MSEEEPKQPCENCGKLFVESKLSLHEAYCIRNFVKCPECGEFIDKNSKEEHFAEEHAKQKCVFCQKDINQKVIKQHEDNECTKRPKKCNFCEMKINYDLFTEHVLSCGTRTKICLKCQKNVMLREYESHVPSCRGPPQQVPVEKPRQETVSIPEQQKPMPKVNKPPQNDYEDRQNRPIGNYSASTNQAQQNPQRIESNRIDQFSNQPVRPEQKKAPLDKQPSFNQQTYQPQQPSYSQNQYPQQKSQQPPSSQLNKRPSQQPQQIEKKPTSQTTQQQQPPSRNSVSNQGVSKASQLALQKKSSNQSSTSYAQQQSQSNKMDTQKIDNFQTVKQSLSSKQPDQKKKPNTGDILDYNDHVDYYAQNDDNDYYYDDIPQKNYPNTHQSNHGPDINEDLMSQSFMVEKDEATQKALFEQFEKQKLQNQKNAPSIKTQPTSKPSTNHQKTVQPPKSTTNTTNNKPSGTTTTQKTYNPPTDYQNHDDDLDEQLLQQILMESIKNK